MPNTTTKYNSRIDAQDAEGNTPLHIAAKHTSNDSLEIVKSIIRGGANFIIKNNQGQKASDIATGEIRQLLLNQELFPAVIEDNLSEVNRLIAEGADVSAHTISPVIKAYKGSGPVFFNSATTNKEDDAATTPSASNYAAKG